MERVSSVGQHLNKGLLGQDVGAFPLNELHKYENVHLPAIPSLVVHLA